jgi:hypothetical protein
MDALTKETEKVPFKTHQVDRRMPIVTAGLEHEYASILFLV